MKTSDFTNELGEKEERLVKLAYHSVRKHVAEALLSLCDLYNKTNEANFTMSITR